MIDEIIPLDAFCNNCKWCSLLTPTILVCSLPKAVKEGIILQVNDNKVCREWKIDDSKHSSQLKRDD